MPIFVGSVDLYTLAWPQVRKEIEAGRTTLVLALGAVEQHGHHMALGTDSVLGEALGRALAERLDAFFAPTIPVGCSHHHLEFPGTMSIEPETFRALVGDIVRGWAKHGFTRIVLVPSHGGNFEPLARAVDQLGALDGVQVIALTDLSLLLEATLGLGQELGVSTAEGGVHGGEWETSLMLALRPELVDMERAVPGYTGDMETGVPRFFQHGAHAVSETGVVGDPTRASAENGRRYFERLLELIVGEVERTSSRL